MIASHSLRNAFASRVQLCLAVTLGSVLLGGTLPAAAGPTVDLADRVTRSTRVAGTAHRIAFRPAREGRVEPAERAGDFRRAMREGRPTATCVYSPTGRVLHRPEGVRCRRDPVDLATGVASFPAAMAGEAEAP